MDAKLLERLKLKPPPEKLFKYRALTNLGRVEHIFKKSELFFSAPLDLNDPFDSRFKVEWNGSAGDRRDWFANFVDTQLRPPHHKRDEAIAKGMLGFVGENHERHKWVDEREFVIEVLGHFSMCCLSARPDDILMWSHYSDCHRGICLEFSLRGTPDFGELRPVAYEREIPVHNPLRPRPDMGFDVLFRKSAHWEYEQEWRSVVTQERHQRAFNTEALTGVILGCEISDEHESQVKSWILAREPAPALYRAVKKRELYELEVVPEPLR